MSKSRRPIARGLQLLLVLTATTLHAQDPTVTSALNADPVFQSWKQQSGVQACGQCHFAGATNAFTNNSTDFCRFDELKFWLINDKHAIARRRVEPLTTDELIAEAKALRTKLGIQTIPEDWFGASNVLSRRICDKLGYDVSTEDGYHRFRDDCLTCHGGYRNEVDDKDFARDGGQQPGISCNYCHQIEQQDEWVRTHGLSPDWRTMPPDQKSDEGMRDLVTVSTQANLCFDCHIGNRSENKFVTHEMYAAGHPPIPSIEIETYCQQMPQHWQSPGELFESLAQNDERSKYFQTNYPGLQPESQFWNTRKLWIGSLTARQKILDLYIDSANAPDGWGDYSLYDCAACHHELKRPSERQARGYPGPPGRPRQAEWPAILVDRLAGEVTSFSELESALAKALTDQPFGDPVDVVPAARALRQRIDAAINEIETTTVDAALAKQLLLRLTTTPHEKLLTYDAARSVVWATQVIAAELQQSGQLDDATAKRFADLGDPDVTGLETELPSGRRKFIFADSLAADLQHRANFDAGRLHKALTSLSQALAR